jgi:hypothetical protein
MGLVFHGSLATPLWAIAFSAVALSWLPSPLPSVMAVVVIGAAASMMIVMVRRLGTRRPTLAVLPVAGPDAWSAAVALNIVAGGVHVRTLETATQRLAHESSDVLDLVRMDDDGGWRLPSQPSLADTMSATRTEDPK